jgi:hypothetical protein
MPFPRRAAATSIEVRGVMVLISITSVPRRAFSSTPPTPRITSFTSGSAGTIVTTASASATASGMLDAPLPPWATNLSTAPWLRL